MRLDPLLEDAHVKDRLVHDGGLECTSLPQTPVWSIKQRRI